METAINIHQPVTEINFWNTAKQPTPIFQNGSQSNVKQLPEILFITSFPPRQCGIATYSQDLVNALNNQFEDSFQCSICALESEIENHVYDEVPKFILDTDCRNAFAKICFKINKDDNIKLVVMQHEFGFFAENEADFKHFFSCISKPIVFVFHTVLPKPDANLLTKVREMVTMSSLVIVMTDSAANILIIDYDIPNYKISVIPHGTHLVPPLDRKKLKEKYQLTSRKVLSTFGLLGWSKNIETTLKALPEVIKIHPETLFLVLGKTHPSLMIQEGEKYRETLEKIVKDLHLERHVRFVNEYLELPVLLEYLQLSDIYLFTSNDAHQAVSGTFSYAVSCGCPIISTPIPHAKEVLRGGNGVIIDFEDSEQLANEIIRLLNDEQLRKEISSKSFHKMASTAWQNSAIAHALLFEELTLGTFKLAYKTPPINLEHLKKMTTGFGMIQFAKISTPDIHSGYTLDDNARALIAMCQHYELYRTESTLESIYTYFLFIKHCQHTNGQFLNYVNEKKDFTIQNTDENLEDSTGRAIWALGFLISKSEIVPNYLIVEAEKLMANVLPHLEKIHSTRAMAFIIKGLHFQNKEENMPLLKTFADRMVQMYKHEKKNDWHWFENSLTYGNSLLPEAMLLAYLSTNKSTYQEIAAESFEFLLSRIFVKGKIKVISNKGWLLRDKIAKNVIGGEQPIDVGYTIMTLVRFYVVFNKVEYKQKARLAFSWFLGNNHLHQIVYNPCTGGCYDGVEAYSVNLNQGAESTLSYLMARLSMEKLQEFDSKEVCQKESELEKLQEELEAFLIM